MKRTLFATCIVALALGVLPGRAFAADPATLTVNGAGTVSKIADSALVDIALVTSDDASASKATDQNNTAFNALRERLRALGVRDDGIRTTSFNVRYVPRPPQLRQPLASAALPVPQQHYGYVATRSLTVTAPRVDAAGRVVDAAVAVSANVNGLRYTLADQRSSVAQALRAAVADAQMQADSVAAAAHVHITGIKSIEVSSAPSPIAFMAREAAPGAATEIAPAPLDVRANVTVTYFIAP